MKRTIEIEDDLQERIDCVKEELRDAYIEQVLERFEDIDELDWDQDFYNGSPCFADLANEFADSSTPIYRSDIKGLWYLHSNDFLDAWDDAGFGDDKPENFEQACICTYLEQKAYEYLNDLEKNLEDLQEAHQEDEGKDLSETERKELLKAWLEDSLKDSI